MAAQCDNGLDTVAVIQMVVHQKPIRQCRTFGDRRQRERKVRRFDYVASPSAQQCFHAIENRWLVVDAKRGYPGELTGVDTGALAGQQLNRRLV